MILLDGCQLHISDVLSVANGYSKICLTPKGKENILESNIRLKEILESKKPVYGISTGYGIFPKERSIQKIAAS